MQKMRKKTDEEIFRMCQKIEDFMFESEVKKAQQKALQENMLGE